jgi:hypothetical protein
MFIWQCFKLLLETRVLMSTVRDIKLLFHTVEIRLLQESEEKEGETNKIVTKIFTECHYIYTPVPQYLFK